MAIGFAELDVTRSPVHAEEFVAVGWRHRFVCNRMTNVKIIARLRVHKIGVATVGKHEIVNGNIARSRRNLIGANRQLKIVTRISGRVKIDGDVLPHAALISSRRPQRRIAERKDAVRLLQNRQSTDVASTHMIPNRQRTKSGLGNTLHLSAHQFRVVPRKQTLIRRFNIHIMSGIVPIRVIARRSRRHRRSEPLASYPIEIIALRDILPTARRQTTNATLEITIAHAHARRIRRRRRRRRTGRTADEFDVVESDIAGETRPSDRFKAKRIRRGTDKRNGALDPSIALGALSRPNLRRFAARFEIDAHILQLRKISNDKVI